MRTALIPLALIVALSFGSKASAQRPDEIEAVQIINNYTVSPAKQRIGFADGATMFTDGRTRAWSKLFLGPLGDYELPFTAFQGIVGFGIIVVALFALLITVSIRRKRKQAR